MKTRTTLAATLILSLLPTALFASGISAPPIRFEPRLAPHPEPTPAEAAIAPHESPVRHYRLQLAPRTERAAPSTLCPPSRVSWGKLEAPAPRLAAQEPATRIDPRSRRIAELERALLRQRAELSRG